MEQLSLEKPGHSPQSVLDGVWCRCGEDHWLVASCDRHWLVLRLVDVVLATGLWLASLRGGDWPCELIVSCACHWLVACGEFGSRIVSCDRHWLVACDL